MHYISYYIIPYYDIFFIMFYIILYNYITGIDRVGVGSCLWCGTCTWCCDIQGEIIDIIPDTRSYKVTQHRL